ncbi:hypothetical protein BST61_g2766 [Cercospora zeina]
MMQLKPPTTEIGPLLDFHFLLHHLSPVPPLSDSDRISRLCPSAVPLSIITSSSTQAKVWDVSVILALGSALLMLEARHSHRSPDVQLSESLPRVG